MAQRIFQFAKAVVTGFLNHRCGLHAAGLTYFSLMAVVPILCLLTVTAKICGADDFARRQITGYADAFIANVARGAERAPAAAPAPSEREKEEKRIAQRVVAEQLRAFVDPLFDQIDRFDVRAFGWIGFAMLMWTVISTLGQIEMSLNEVWEVEKPRPLWKRSILYLLVTGVVPLLAAAALSLPVLRLVRTALDATVGATACTRWLGEALVAILESRLFAWAVTVFFATLVFAFIHALLPNRRVRILPALAGGFATAVMLGGWIKLCTVAQVGIGRCSAFYGSFATPVILLAWLYMSWQIVLLGACLTCSLQTFRYLRAPSPLTAGRPPCPAACR